MRGGQRQHDVGTVQRWAEDPLTGVRTYYFFSNYWGEVIALHDGDFTRFCPVIGPVNGDPANASTARLPESQ